MTSLCTFAGSAASPLNVTSQGVAAQSSVASSRTLAPAGSDVILIVAVRASALGAGAVLAAAVLVRAALVAGAELTGSTAGRGCTAVLDDVMRNAAMPSTPPSAAATSTPTPIHAFEARRD